VRFLLLGPVEVRNGESVVAVGGVKQRALLALLLLHTNEPVSRDRLIDELWGEAALPGAGHRLETQISRLRKALALDGELVTRAGGYQLMVDPQLIDSHRFEQILEEGRAQAAAGQLVEAAQTLREALELWRGGALADLAYEPFARVEIERLEELRLAALEERIEVDLALARHQAIVGELEPLTRRHPLRERLRGQLMLALYRCGRQAEALEAYQQFRRALSEQLGLDPGPGLQQLELAILRRDPRLDLPTRSAVPAQTSAQPSGAREAPGRKHRPLIAMAAAFLMGALVLTGVLVASSGGRAPPVVIPGDAVGAISPSGGPIRAVVPLGTSPSGVTAGDGAIWVANQNAGTVARIDPVTRSVVQTVEVGSVPTGIAIGGGAVWVSNNDGGTLSRIEPTVNQVVQTIPVGNAPTGVAVGYGSVWVANSGDGTLDRIDENSGTVTATIPLGAGATDVAVGAGAVWVSDEGGNRVYEVDPQSDQLIAAIDAGTGPTSIVVGFGSVWVANSLDGTVSRIDPTTNRVDETVAVGDGARAIAVGRGRIWVANQYAGTVSRINPATDAVARTTTVGNEPQGLAVAGGLVWVAAQPSASRHRGGTLKLLSLGQASTADPVLTDYAASAWVYDGLTAYQRFAGSDTTQLVPDLAVSLPSPTDGGTSYTFRLRRGIRFSNGELVRPEDFRRAIERDLIIGPNPAYGDPFTDVVGAAACVAHPNHCDLSRGVVTDDVAGTVTFRLVAPDPEFLAHLSLGDAVAVPPDAPDHDVGMHPLPATGPYMFATWTPHYVRMLRNPYFREWSHAAQPDGYADQIVFHTVTSESQALGAVERGSADYAYQGVPPDRLNELQTQFPSRLYVNPLIATDALVLNTRVAPFDEVRVRHALNYAIDRAKVLRLLGQDARLTCQILPPYLLGYQRYCPYTLDPNPAGIWHAPDLAKARSLIAASHTRGTPVTIWNLGAYQTDFTPIEPYIVSLLDQLGYPTTVKDVSNDPNSWAQFSQSGTNAQAALTEFETGGSYPSPSQILQVGFSCQYFAPRQPGNTNISEFCDHRLDAQINSALAAESNNSPNAASRWAQADRTATDAAPVVALDNPSNIDFVSSRVGNYQYSIASGGIFADQLWVR
jgi:YVTN family beta-propeller protein